MFEQIIDKLGSHLMTAFNAFVIAVLFFLVCGALFLIGSVLVRLICRVNDYLAKNIHDIKNDHDGWR